MCGKYLSFVVVFAILSSVSTLPSHRTYSDDSLERKISPEDCNYFDDLYFEKAIKIESCVRRWQLLSSEIEDFL